MQATKLSSNKKGSSSPSCNGTSNQQRGHACAPPPPPAGSSPLNDKKSVAQRVMEVTTTTTATATSAASSKTTTTATKEKTSQNGTSHLNNNNNNSNNNNNNKVLSHHNELSSLKRPASSNNSTNENDREVENITNRLAGISRDISPPVNLLQTSSNNLATNADEHRRSGCQTKNTTTNTTTTRANSSSSLQLLPPTTISTGGNSTQRQNQKHQPHEPPGDILISLDTRVPHPANNNPSANFGPNGQFRNEEVSYYNDAPIQPLQETATRLLEPKQVGGSLDNNTKPKLLQLAAASSALREQNRLGRSVCHMASGNLPKQAADLPASRLTASACKQMHLIQQQAELPPQPASGHRDTVYEHNYMSADVYDDVTYDLHYDNALVMEKEAANVATKNQKQLHQRDTSTGATSSTRYQEIPEFSINDNDEGHEQQQQTTSQRSQTFITTTTGQNNLVRQSNPNSVSISTSPKAKSAPATPCNITPTAFHQNAYQHNQIGRQNPNTLPPDIRKNISATCRVLPTSIGLPSDRGGGGGNGARIGPLEDYNRRVATTNLRHQQQTSKQQQQQQQQQQLQVNLKHLDSLVERAELALRNKDYQLAVKLFTQAINLASDNSSVNNLKKNFKIYAQRAEAHFHLCQYNEAIDDSMAARELNPKWTQAYYLQGQSQFMIGRYADSLAVFSFGLTQDPQNELLFQALVKSALNSSATESKKEFQLKFNKLKALGRDQRPFFVVSILGQELLAAGHSEHAAIILESALKLSSLNSKSSIDYSNEQVCKFKCSVLSTISLAYCTLRDYDKAISYMLRELELVKELDDIPGQCRVLSNLGFTYYKVRKFDNSLKVHREQLNLALKMNLLQQASQAFNAIGHVHAAKGDYSNALTSHMRCLDILKTLEKNPYAEFRELLSLGHIHSQLNDLDAAEERFSDANDLLNVNQTNKSLSQEEFASGSIMVKFNLAYLSLRRQTRDSFHKAKLYYMSMIEIAQTLNGADVGSVNNKTTTNTSTSQLTRRMATYEMRAYHGLGQTCRLLKELDDARGWFEKQLSLAKTLKDIVGQSQALCNLGLVSQQHCDQQYSWRRFEENLKLVDGDPLLKAYAHSYMGLANSLNGRTKESMEHYETSLDLFKELGYCLAEQKTIEDNIVSIQRRMNQNDLIDSLPTVANNIPLASGGGVKKVMLASS